MPIIENSTVVSAPREEVFDALVDLRGELVWNPKVELMEKITDGPVGLGNPVSREVEVEPGPDPGVCPLRPTGVRRTQVNATSEFVRLVGLERVTAHCLR